MLVSMITAIGGSCLLASRSAPSIRCCTTTTSSSSSASSSPIGNTKLNHIPHATGRFAVASAGRARKNTRSTKRRATSETAKRRFVEDGSVVQKKGGEEAGVVLELLGEKKKKKNPYALEMEKKVSSAWSSGKRLKDYFEESKDMITADGGPPRWFSPLECGSRLDNSPLLLFLPGIDGVGLGLIMHHHSLGKIFDIWCLHIPVKDRTSFLGLVKLVEKTVRSESDCSHDKPIYLLGDSIGACIALAVAARNPDIDIQLILVNPATSFENSQLQPLVPFLEFIPNQHQLTIPYILSLITGDSLRMAMDDTVSGVPLQETVEGLSQDVVSIPSYINVLGDILPRNTLLWKLQMFKIASAFANSHLHAIKSQTLILSSGKDQLFPSEAESQRLSRALPRCDIRKFKDSGHFLLLEYGVDLAKTIKGAAFYRRGKRHDYVLDYVPVTPTEFRTYKAENRSIMQGKGTVMFSTLENGKIIRGLAGVPLEGPVIYVGYHMLMGWDVSHLAFGFLEERNILLRGLAHPILFSRFKEGKMPPLSEFDVYRGMGSVPVSAANLYKLLSTKAHVLLYPGGMREACHRKGEQYKLFWPEHSEFVRMAARFGAKIVPFGSVGEDDFGEVVFDYDDQMKIPFLRDFNRELTSEGARLRPGEIGEVGNQDSHIVGVLPIYPGGRFYFYFGKPIETEGRKQELKDREKAHELYLQIKSEVEKNIAFLKENRERDPYRNLLARLAYQAIHGFTSEVPTFEL